MSKDNGSGTSDDQEQQLAGLPQPVVPENVIPFPAQTNPQNVIPFPAPVNPPLPPIRIETLLRRAFFLDTFLRVWLYATPAGSREADEVARRQNEERLRQRQNQGGSGTPAPTPTPTQPTVPTGPIFPAYPVDPVIEPVSPIPIPSSAPTQPTRKPTENDDFERNLQRDIQANSAWEANWNTVFNRFNQLKSDAARYQQYEQHHKIWGDREAQLRGIYESQSNSLNRHRAAGNTPDYIWHQTIGVRGLNLANDLLNRWQKQNTQERRTTKTPRTSAQVAADENRDSRSQQNYMDSWNKIEQTIRNEMLRTESWDQALADRWTQRSTELTELRETYQRSFEQWLEKNKLAERTNIGGLVVETPAPVYIWYESQGKECLARAQQLLRQWQKEEAQRKPKQRPQTAEEINRQIQQPDPTKKPNGTPEDYTLDPVNPVASDSQTEPQKPSEEVTPSQEQQPDKKKTPQQWQEANARIKAGLERRLEDSSLTPTARGKLEDNIKSLDTDMERLRSKGVMPETIAALSTHGLHPSALETYLKKDEILKKNNAGVSAEEIASLYLKLLSRFSTRIKEVRGGLEGGIKNERQLAGEIIENAISDKRAYELTRRLVYSNDIENPDRIIKIVGNLATQKSPQARKGNMLALELAAEIVRTGNKITIERNGDIVDENRLVVWQAKNIDGTRSKTLTKELQDAVDQVNGVKGEIPLSGYKKAVYIRITNVDHPDYNKTPEQWTERIREMLQEDNRLGKIDQIQIRIGNRTHIFDIDKGQNIKHRSYPSDRYLTDSTIPIQQPLLTALSNYYRVVNYHPELSLQEENSRDSTTNRSRLTSIQFELTGILLEQMQSAKAEINQSLESPQVKLDTAQARVNNHDFDRGM